MNVNCQVLEASAFNLNVYENFHSSTLRQQAHLSSPIFILRSKIRTLILSQNIVNVLTTNKNY